MIYLKIIGLSTIEGKGIRKLENFDLNKITVLSGVNSCGKSSLIQFLLPAASHCHCLV